MKLRTSFFKWEALRKDILRFAPIWGIYLIGMMLVLMESFGSGSYDRLASNMLPGMVSVFGIVNLLYAGLVANALFGDLYNTKLCYSLHAMPYRRESWMLTHLTSGLLFSLVPNCVATLYLMVQLEDYWIIGLWWLLAATLQYLFFYGVATVSAMLTGNRFAMLLVYAGFNFVAMLLYATVEVLYVPMLTGVVVNVEDFTRFSPTVQLFEYTFFEFTRIQKQVSFTDLYDEYIYFYQYDGLGTGWGYSAILAGVGAAAMGISFFLYRLRHLESAGDFIAFPKLKWIACVIMTLCVALCFALVGELFNGGGYILWMIVGFVVGFFGSLMLLERRIKVFRKNTLLVFGGLAIAVIISMVAVELDWLGIESWTPKANQVQSVTLSNSKSESYYNRVAVTLEDPEDIANIIEAHGDIYQRVKDYNLTGNYQSGQFQSVCLTYKLKSGRTVIRYYNAPAVGPGYQTVIDYLFNPESILGFKDPMEGYRNVRYIHCTLGQVPPSMHEAFLSTLMNECIRGYVTTDSNKYTEYFVEYYIELPDGSNVYRALQVDRRAEELVTLMKSTEFAMGYTIWEDFLDAVENLTVVMPEAVEIPQENWEQVLTALRKDIESGAITPGQYGTNSFMLSYELQLSDGNYDYKEFTFNEKAVNLLQALGVIEG